MDSSKLYIKFHLDPSSPAIKTADIVPVFHSWIQLHRIPDHLLIDVADYAHLRMDPVSCWSLTKPTFTWIVSTASKV